MLTSGFVEIGIGPCHFIVKMWGNLPKKAPLPLASISTRSQLDDGITLSAQSNTEDETAIISKVKM